MNKEEKSNKSKEKIITAAFTLFAAKGYVATSTQDIINLSGLSRGAMYHHFKSKEDILKSVIRELHKHMNVFLEDLAADQSLTVKEKITKLLEYSGSDYTQRQLVVCCWIEKIPFALLQEIRHYNDVIAVYLSQIIQQGADHGEFKCDYPRELAEVLVLLIDIWLDPVLFKRSYDEICSRLDFLMYFLQSIQISIVDHKDIQKFKTIFKHHLGLMKEEETTN